MQQPDNTKPITRHELIRQMVEEDIHVDVNLPIWARRSNALVRRHLGQAWRTMPPQVEPIVQWYLIQSAVVLASVPFPFLLTIILPAVIISMFLLPPALVYFGRTLYGIASDSARSMVAEIEGHTIDLLRVSPMTTREILLSKIAGVLWRQSDPLAILLSIATFSQLPTLILIYTNYFPPDTHGNFAAPIFTILVFAVTIIRIPIEAFMVGAIGQYIGVTTRGRETAAATTLTLTVFYFIMINVPRLGEMSLLLRGVVEIALPIVAPLVIIWLALRTTEELIS